MALVNGLFISVKAETIRFTVQVSPVSDTIVDVKCVGALVRPDALITAGHCVPADAQFLHLECWNGDDQRVSVTAATIVKLELHPIYDVAILRLENAKSCDAKPFKISETKFLVNASSPDVYIELPMQNGKSAHFRALVIGRDAHTFHIEDAQVCLTKGHSGSLLLVKNEVGLLSLAGLLIAGTKDCPSHQIFVRLDPIKSWIERVAR